MTTHAYHATRTEGAGSITITRSTTDGIGSALAAFEFDDTTVLDKLVLKELFKDILHEVARDFTGVSHPVHLTADGGEGAFDDGAFFDDNAIFSDMGGARTWQATITATNAHTIVASDDDALGSADAVLILNASQAKGTLWKAVREIERALNRDAISASAPASFPTSEDSIE